jgi:hypothetical protein
MPNALTLDDMSPRLRKVVGRESPRVTSTEEPDGGNLLVRIWRGAGVGNLPAYSTTVFLLRCLRERPAGAPTAWTPQRLCVPLPAPAGQRAGEVRGRLQGAPGARAGARLAGGEGGWHPGRHRRAGTQEAFAARTSPAGPRWRGLSRTRISLSDSGRVQWEVGRTRAGDDVGYA